MSRIGDEKQTGRKLKWLDEKCNSCGHQINSWDKRVSKALSYKAPHCEECIAKEYDLDVERLRSLMSNYFGEWPCLGL